MGSSDSSDNDVSYYPYNPSSAAALTVAIVYFIGFALTVGQTIWKRSWIWLVMALAMAAEVVGYIARYSSAKHVTERNPYVIQFTLIILAPVLMAGVIYVVFARMVFWVVPPEQRSLKLLWVSPRFITLIFVGFDVLALLLQIGAAILISGAQPTNSNFESTLNTGKNLGLTGVTLQLIAFGFFSFITVRFQFISKKISREYSEKNRVQNNLRAEWNPLLWVLNLSCLFILIRSIYREVEFGGGKDGVTQRSEWYMYVFDTLPILGVVVLYVIWFPGRLISNIGWRLPKQYRKMSTDNEAMDLRQM